LGNVEPDVLFRIGNTLGVVEAKFRSDRHDLKLKVEWQADGDQLVHQHRALHCPVSEHARYSQPMASSEKRLASMIENKDARLAADLDKLAGLVSSLHGRIEVQQAELNDLANWRDASSTHVAHQVVSLASVLSMLSNVVTINPARRVHG
jgi:hypothetical protein